MTRLTLLIAALLGCASRVPAQQVAPDTAQDLPPAGYGTLHQEDVALRLATETVQLRVIPLDERITRLLARDSYESLARLAAGHARSVDSLAIRNGLQKP